MGAIFFAFEQREIPLDVRRFAVHEALSEPTSLSVWGRSPLDDVDFEQVIGRGAELHLDAGFGPRSWQGLVAAVELLHAEPSGLSTYYVRIVPRLWLLAQRRTSRLFQHQSIPDVVDALLAEWKIEAVWRVRRADYPKLELRCQYGESDLVFLCRLLEEAGISYAVEAGARGPVLVLSDAPEAAQPRAPLPFVDNPARAPGEWIADVRVARDVRPGKVTIRDHDARRSPDFDLTATASADGPEAELEQHHFQPGAFLVELEEDAAAALDHKTGLRAALARGGGAVAALSSASSSGGPGQKLAGAVLARLPGLADAKVADLVDARVTKLAGGVVGDLAGELAGDVAGAVAGKIGGAIAGAAARAGKLAGDDRGFARSDEKAGQALAGRRLEAIRGRRYQISFSTNSIGLVPGAVFSLAGHPRRDLSPDRRLLVVEQVIEGALEGDWSTSCVAVFADAPHRPLPRTPKPRMGGPQTAVVVGPPGEEIHTDELGRVRVQFHWDRAGARDDGSSCWMRLAQGWGGPGYGMMSVPRVGTEVMVTFLEGDPDQPVVTGTVANATSPTPHVFPQHKTRSTWKSASSPGGGGSNELMFDDAKGAELLFLQAERNLQQIVKKDRGAIVGAVDTTLVGERYRVAVAQPAQPPAPFDATSLDVADRKITLSTGEASITLDGPDVIIEAKGRIVIRSSGGDVVLRGGPMVRINSEDRQDATALSTPASAEGTHPVPGLVTQADYLSALQRQLEAYRTVLLGSLPGTADPSLVSAALDKQIERVMARQRAGSSTVGEADTTALTGEKGLLGAAFQGNYAAQHGSALHDLQAAYVGAAWGEGGNYQSTNRSSAVVMALHGFGTDGAAAAAKTWSGSAVQPPQPGAGDGLRPDSGPHYQVPPPPNVPVPYPSGQGGASGGGAGW